MFKMVKTIQNYKKLAYMQEKLRKFRQYRPFDLSLEGASGGEVMAFGSNNVREGFDPRRWWKFAITSIIKSF